ncbi:MAG: ParB/RepB/Spo0J family partition protein [Oscillospiraceae bacterium]|nr:ParB/RepB/Spo0J family partition protein [Oscillospiraceae bacterium]
MRLKDRGKPEPGMVLQLPLGSISPNPNQPRRQFCPVELQGLAESIRENGILQPLAVRRLPNETFELIAGERRLRAAKLAGLERVPCLMSYVTDERSAVLALVENLQRQDLGFFEEAAAIHKLLTCYRLSQEQAARQIGMAPSTLSNKLRLLKLPADLRDEIEHAKLTERHARALLRVTDPVLQRELLQRIIKRKMNVHEAETFITNTLQEVNVPARARPHVRLVRDVRLFVNTIHHAVDTMRSSGIEAHSEKSENDDYLIYTVMIPKERLVATRRV